MVLYWLIHAGTHALTHTHTQEHSPLPFLYLIILGWSSPSYWGPVPTGWVSEGSCVSTYLFLYRNVDIFVMWLHYSSLSTPPPSRVVPSAWFWDSVPVCSFLISGWALRAESSRSVEGRTVNGKKCSESSHGSCLPSAVVHSCLRLDVFPGKTEEKQ